MGLRHVFLMRHVPFFKFVLSAVSSNLTLVCFKIKWDAINALNGLNKLPPVFRISEARQPHCKTQNVELDI